MEILIIGGTRNVGHLLTLELLRHGHQVTLFNRGQTPDELPASIRRIHGDRSNASDLEEGLAGKSFDVVVDMALYNGKDAEVIARLLDGRVGQYIFLSTGQIYLVREEARRPFAEEDAERPLTPAPLAGTRDHEEWLYGVQKSEAETVLLDAWQARRFPVSTLRLPMVNSERDHFHRVYGYLLRMQDGGPILVPAGTHLSLRHIYARDVLQAILRMIDTGAGKGRAYNLSQEETLSIDEFLSLLAETAGYRLRRKRIDRTVLENLRLLPDCSPFSDPWMSELDNRRSRQELGMQYTPLTAYLQNLVKHYRDSQVSHPQTYRRRAEELRLAEEA